MSVALCIFLAHPALHRSRINASLTAVAATVEGVEVVDLYDAYPDFDIDVKREQDRLLQVDAIILQHPFYWYSVPALLKEWVDLVFAYGFAYGKDQKKLSGKLLTQAMSTGGDAGSYHADGFNRFTIADFCRPWEATAHFCDMRWRQPFVTHGSHNISDAAIEQAGDSYRKWLLTIKEELAHGR